MRTIQVESVSIDGTIGQGRGLDVETGQRVVFGGDWRPMQALGEAVDDGEEPLVEIEEWQVLRTGPGGGT